MASSINVCFSTTNGLMSRIIRWFTRAKTSHALITFRSETLDKVFVMEANGRGFMLQPWAKWRRKNTLVARYALAVPTAQQMTALRALAEFLGTEYDYVSLLGFAWRRFRARSSNPFDDPTQLICSEAVAKFLAAAGLNEFSEAETWTPGDLLAAAKKMGAFQLVEGVE
jgi:hypothetical protein